MNFSETPEFKKDVKRLSKKWRSIPMDIEAVKPYILPLYTHQTDEVTANEYRRAFFAGKIAAILHTQEGVEVVKMRLDVADLGRSDKVRIIFIAVKTNDTIRFVELYAKNEKSREDSSRYRSYI